MTTGQGLPSRVDFIPLPGYYLNLVMPQVEDIYELKLTLHLFKILYRKKSHPRFVAEDEMLNDPALTESIRQPGVTIEQSLRQAIEKAALRGMIIELEIETQGEQAKLYFLNTPDSRDSVEDIKNGRLQLTWKKQVVETAAIPEQLPEIFGFYEANIGMLTPIIADELRLAEQIYPRQWIIEAIREAALNNKHNWRYISRILERWQSEGKTHGTHRQNNQQDDPSRFTTGKYQHFVEH